MKTKIGFLDSGIGGVTVLRECINLVGNFSYVYYSDSLNNPYGDKNVDELLEVVDKVVVKLINYGCYVIVIACNTASSVCVAYLREKYSNIKFVAIVPAIKLIYDNNNGSGTLVMATNGTIESDMFKNLYNKYSDNNCYLLSCGGLADLIENDKVGEIEKYLYDNLSYYKNIVSSVVLGCTHYPLIKDKIIKILGNVTFFDGSIGVAKQLVRIINDNGYVSDGDYKVVFIDSSNNIDKRKRFFRILEG